MHAGIGATLVFGQFQHSRFCYFSWQPMPPLHLLQVAVGFFTPDSTLKKR
jgi:hypothetical protein